MWDGLLAWMDRIPNALVYIALGAGAGVENVVPAVPADTFVVLGGFLSALGDLQARWVFAATWLGNVASAVAMYQVGRTHGRAFFTDGPGRRFLNAHQMERLAVFYARWGTAAIFVTRFLPGIRAVVPVFAGVTHQRPVAVVPPLAAASAIWYGGLVLAGATAGRHLDRVMEALRHVNLWLLAAAVAAGAAAAWSWWSTRHHG